MISAYTIPGASLLWAALITVNDDIWKKPEHIKRINRFGGVGSVMLPFVTFAALNGFRAL